MYILILERLFFEAILDIFYFPLWWYSRGLAYASLKVWHIFLSGNERLAPGLWLKNLFVPMYGQYDWQGRLISLGVRLVQIIFRSLALLVWLAVCVLMLSAWLVFPLVVARGLIGSIISK